MSSDTEEKKDIEHIDFDIMTPRNQHSMIVSADNSKIEEFFKQQRKSEYNFDQLEAMMKETEIICEKYN